MNKHIVIITGSYGKYMSPGGNIVSGLVEELSKEYSVTLVSHKEHFGETIINDGSFQHELIEDYATCIHHFCIEKIHSSNRVWAAFFSVVLKGKQVVNAISMHCRKYGYSELLKRKTLKKIDRIRRTKPIDVLIGVSEPHDSVAAVCEYKEIHSDIRAIIYQLDRFSNGNSLYKYKLFKEKAIKANKKREIFFLNACDKCFVLPPIYPHYEDELFNNVREKIEITEHPLVRRYDTGLRLRHKENVIVYAGSFDQKLRNPEYWLKLFIQANEMHEDMPTFRCFSFGNCEETVFNYSKLSNQKIERKGKVPYSQIKEEYEQFSCILIIGNNSKEEVPSKVFDCISYGKGIIYLHYFDDDPVLPYLSKYPMAISIKMNPENMEIDAQRLHEFCKKSMQQDVDRQEIIELYQECTPQFVSQQFKRVIEQ